MNEIIGFIFNQYVGFGGIFSFFFALIQILKGRTLKNFILFLIFFSMGIILIKGLVLLNGFGFSYSHFFSFENFFIFLIGPSLFIYFNLLLLNEKVNLRILLPHYIPTVLFLIGYTIDTIFIISENRPLNDLNEKFESRYDLIYRAATIITIVYFSVILAKFVELFKENISEYPWSKHIISILSIGLTGVIITLLNNFRFLFSLYEIFIPLYFLCLSILTFTVLYAFVISQVYPITFNIVSETFQKMSYQKSTLQNVDSDDLVNRLETLMLQDKVYLEVGITLNRLAEKLNIKSHQLSELLNNNLNKSFFTYVNQFRIEEAKVLLLSEKESSVIKIAFDSGFNSLSVFNTVFKKEVGMTPSQFRKIHS
ncbi:AraC family transcriptional regulator [Leptospira adleri]|uniref:HTH araC/xylS-type domain-containing protein n=1 Tax=Leptospira adleri TaxID=2023186 RepID=A0A2M9YMM7_9LEPT|nr:helix-turn-helix domain-containing protein [Leptospira adleri]PJZ52792.1 hypothetical protein CH380_13685 [Leptospira adleri]PJZ60326.1 hypothetical protein CH376_19075 [Leptospira adleri]